MKIARVRIPRKVGDKKKKKLCLICGRKYFGLKCPYCLKKDIASKKFLYPPKNPGTLERIWNNEKDEVWNVW